MPRRKRPAREQPRGWDPGRLTWPPPLLTPRMAAFLERTVAALRAAHPEVTFDPDPLEFAVMVDKERGSDWSGQINLHNLYENERRHALARERGEPPGGDAVQDVLRTFSFIRGRGQLTRDELLARAKPMLLCAGDYLDLSIVRRPLRTPALHLAYAVDFEVGVSWITEEQLAEHGVGRAELHAAALENMAEAGLRLTGLGRADQPDGLIGALVEAEDGLGSSRVFEEPLRAKLTELFPAGYRLLVPGRELLLVLSASRMGECGQLLRQAREDHATASHPLSPEPFSPGELVPRDLEGW